MKTDIFMELAKLIGFFGLGYYGLLTYQSIFYALPLAMLGSAIVHFTYLLCSKD